MATLPITCSFTSAHIRIQASYKLCLAAPAPGRCNPCTSSFSHPKSSFRERNPKKLPLLTSSGSRILAKAAEVAVQTDASSIPTLVLKEFLQELKTVGRIRIIVNTGVGILESVTSLEKLFYHTVAGKGEYANLMNKEENVDFHLLLEKVTAAKFVKGKSMRGDIPTYTIRFIDAEDKAAASFLLMWKPGTNGEYDPGQVEAFEALFAKYGDTLSFKT